MLTKACDMLGMGGVPIRTKDNKVKLEALNAVAKLDFDKLKADEHDEVLAKKIQTALVGVVKANIHSLWALAPVVKAISEIGANGLDIPHVHEMRITADIAADMRESIIKRGDAVTSESMRQENIKRLREDYGIKCDMRTKGWLVLTEDEIIAEFNEKAIEEYALRSIGSSMMMISSRKLLKKANVLSTVIVVGAGTIGLRLRRLGSNRCRSSSR
jgi:hypothetical protein